MDEPVSKSAKKRQAHALQKLGVELVELSEAKLLSLPLSENLYKAIMDAKTIKSHEAKRRQAQLIGKLMRQSDFDAILDAYQIMLDEGNALTAHFHEIETWRDKLIEGDKESLTEFINLYRPDDIQALQQLIRKAKNERLKEQYAGGTKALFRYLRAYIK